MFAAALGSLSPGFGVQVGGQELSISFRGKRQADSMRHGCQMSSPADGAVLGVSCSCLELELGLAAPVTPQCSPELRLSLVERIYNPHRRGLIEGDLTQQGTPTVTGN